MKHQVLSAVNCLILFFFLTGCGNAVEEPEKDKFIEVGPPSGSGTYEDLIVLFDEFIEFRKPSENAGIPDYSDEEIERKKILILDYKSKLKDMNVVNW